MKRSVRVGSVGIGIALIGIGIGTAVLGFENQLLTVLLVGLAIVGALVGLAVKYRGSLPREHEGALPWSEGDHYATPAPERTPRSDPLSSDRLALLLREAGSTARSNRELEGGVAVLRPVLRETLEGVLEAGGHGPTEVEAMIESGEWTEDALAAWVVSGSVPEPPESVRRRLRRWLFPERELRDRTHVTVGAIARTAAVTVPAVPGQEAPRTVPVVTPRLEDGEFTRANDSGARAGELP